MLAESGNLLTMMPGRAGIRELVNDSKMMVDAGAAAFKAARSKDLDGVRAVNDLLYTACVTCHEQYRTNYPKRGSPEQKGEVKFYA